jgi:hypothetical protein
MKLPNFLFVGAAKTGSTWMYRTLAAHPEVYVPSVKEIHFFDDYYDKGLTWYSSFFTPAGDDYKAVGELSPRYLYSAEALNRIDHDLPGVKLFACLRNPIDRAISGYHFKIRNGIARPDFFSTMEANPEILTRGKYLKYVQMYLDRFSADRFRVLMYDDLKENPTQFAKDLYRYLGVDAAYNHSGVGRSVFPASVPRVFWLATLTKKVAVLLRKKGHIRLIGRFQNSPFFLQILYRPMDTEEKQRAITNSERSRLIEFYEDDVRQVGRLLNKDLSHWLE